MHFKELYNKYKLKFKSKPWITLGLQKSISVKNKLPTNSINKKDPIIKEEFLALKFKMFLSLKQRPNLLTIIEVSELMELYIGFKGYKML